MVRQVAVVLMLPAIALALFPAGCSTNPVTGERELILISREQEITMGQEAAPRFEEEFGGRVADETLQSYVQSIGGALAARSDRDMPYEFILVQSGTPNAFALPGGKVFITAGLMSYMTNERQLAAVLGHEVGHVAARHNVKRMQMQMGTALLLDIAERAVSGKGQGAQRAKDIGQIIGAMVNLRYSRDDEYQADKLGVEYMSRAGYNPWGMVELLTVLMNLSEEEGGRLEEMFRTHPLTSNRIEEARETIEAQPSYEKFSADAPDPHRQRFLRMRRRLVEAASAGGS